MISESMADLHPWKVPRRSFHNADPFTLAFSVSQVSRPQTFFPSSSESLSPLSRMTRYRPQAFFCHFLSDEHSKGLMAWLASGKCLVRKYWEANR